MNISLRKTRAAVDHALRDAKTDAAHLRLLDLLHALKAYETAVATDPAEVGTRLERLRTATARVVGGARSAGPVPAPPAATVSELDEELAGALWNAHGREPELLGA
ncbi:hypothetical protein [Streptomonospora salina]|uniref:Uncharacterized protein n=1 Tax=Streptomonospora salina TaxID=104205 RepID=A0A841E2U6_9ACTN|nr:hypothetical protein [Streptomonospora salina]MBB5997356.1 hypothetical protein [Streptomonospora salina]